jgi:RNA polymerase sigma-70 factor (ECF subfamily)
MAVSVPFTDRLTVIQIPVAEKVDNLQASPLAPTVDPSDDEILERLAAGDSNSLVYLFKRYYRLVWTIGMRVLRDKSEAEDLTQDVFLYVFQKSHLFSSSKGHARNWLVRVTYHRAFDRRDYLKARFSNGHEELKESGAHNGSSGRKPFSDFGDWICLRVHLEKGLNELSEEQRMTVRLHFYEGYTFREIGEHLGLSHGNVRHHYYRGIERLRRFIFDKGMRENPGE